VDDLLDYQGQADVTGKNIGDDFRERKLTLPLIKAVAQANAEERGFWQCTIETGQQNDGDLDTALTLLHDDVVDESAQRRGRPTANLLWDNKSSVLVGDYLFARSFQLMVETGSLRVLDILSNASATIAEGEVLQLSAAQDLATDEDVYLQVVRGKTAALFSAATEVGGVIAGVPEAHVQALFDYGDALGIAFQIVDDLLDYQGQADVTGKNIGDDFRERKLTLPLIKAVARADAEERSFWQRTIETGQQNDGDLDTALTLLNKHGALDQTRQDALGWAAKAKAALEPLPAHDIKDMLGDLADYVVERIN